MQEKASEQKKQAHDSIVYSEEEAGDLSDKVAPVSRPEAAGWSFVIVAAYGITAFLIYTVYTSIIVEAPEDKVFNQALEAVRKDFRVTSILGSTIKGAYSCPSLTYRCSGSMISTCAGLSSAGVTRFWFCRVRGLCGGEKRQAAHCKRHVHRQQQCSAHTGAIPGGGKR